MFGVALFAILCCLQNEIILMVGVIWHIFIAFEEVTNEA
jgi:hypothetical protein